jgi:hypothetical protein
MAEAGFQAIVAYSPGNQFWLSGFRGSAGAGRIAEYTQQVVLPKVVLPLTGEPALTGLPAIAEAYAQETYFGDIRPVMSPADRAPQQASDTRALCDDCRMIPHI